MSKITRGCVGVVVHVDDILVMENNKDDHDINLKNVLRCIEESGMTLNEEKCKIGLEEVEFIGFRIGKDGIRAGQKVQEILEYPPPKDL